jgi:hypothetical protein
MLRKTLCAVPAVCALTIAGCSGSPETVMSPSAVARSSTAANPDGSTLKVTAPSGLSPNGVVIDSRRPTLSFSASTGVFAPVTSSTYDVEVQDAAGAVIYSRLITGTSHVVETDAPYSTTLWFRSRLRINTDVGPWSGFAQFRTPEPPVAVGPAPPTGGGGGAGLPFPVPAECGPGGPGNRIACAAAVAAVSAEWQLCASGRGVGCNRFTRQVVYALAQSDPNWKMILAAPGGNACSCTGCGPSDGTMFREDTTVYAGSQVFDLVVGAGGPSPSLTWSSVPGPRPGDLPADAPLCSP